MTKAIIYVRQSWAREDSISADMQEAACRSYAAQQGYEVVGVEQDLGVSGRTFNRPAVTRTMSAVESGAAQVIILWKWSRLSRVRLDWSMAQAKAELVGARIESATEPADVTTSTGRLAREIMIAFSVYESERIGETWAEARAKLTHMGRFSGGNAWRLGYTYSRDDGFQINPETAGYVTALYGKFAAGQCSRQLVEWLRAEKIQHFTPWNATSSGYYTESGLQRSLDTGFAAGYLNMRHRLYPGVHEPIVGADLWEEYKDMRRRRALKPEKLVFDQQ